MTATNSSPPQAAGGPAPAAGGAAAGGRTDAGELSRQSSPGALPLLAPMAFPVVRDRWERLVTATTVPQSPARVWKALVDPDELSMWLGRGRTSLQDVGVDVVLDFEDGEFFLVRTQSQRAPDEDGPGELHWVWRWLGLGQPASVTWHLQGGADGPTSVTVTEEVNNPPADWQTWNGGGWPGILEQLASYLRTGTEWRWPWRRMGPYVQVELEASPFEAWDTLMGPAAVKFWLSRMSGQFATGESATLMMGDASGTVQMTVRELVDAGQKPPSFLPYLEFSLSRGAWGGAIGGRLWIEPAGWGRSLLQVFHYGWESLPAGPALVEERKILTSFWAGAARRAMALFMRGGAQGGPHSWT